MEGLEIVLSVTTIVSTALAVFVIILLNKSTKVVESYEEIIDNQATYISKISYIIEDSRENINKLDDKGAFKSDDEVGRFFESLKEIQQLLNTFTVPKEYGKKEKEGDRE